ncbi:MAG: hypothetical protein AAF830_15630 [Pseudomonadota bacterium]
METRHILLWVGPLRGFAMEYQVQVQWDFITVGAVPVVFILAPKIAPRPGTDFVELPHLLYNAERPEESGLCLFDPDDRQWDGSKFIADTIVPWASEWLHHYEFWQLDGVWRGANAPGPISVGEMIRLEEVGDVEGA